jgi:hypothetical protein
MESTNHCQKCHQLLERGAVICSNCGAPAPGVYFFDPPQPPVSSGPSNSGRGVRFWLGLAGIIGGSLCGCLALVLGFLFLSREGSKTPTLSQSNPSNQQVAPAPITQPPSEVPAITITAPTEVPTVPPTQEATPTTGPANNNVTQYFDDFSNINGAWQNVFEDSLIMGYFQKGNYAITLRAPQKMAVAFPPYPFTKPINNMIVSVKAKGDGEDGFYGVLCHYQDQYNYYRASFSGDQYAVDKMVNGQSTELTSPFWKKIVAYQPDADGYLTITLACTDGRVQILVNDVGQDIITDMDLDQGDALLFAASGDTINADGIYEQAFFDDFSAELLP